MSQSLVAIFALFICVSCSTTSAENAQVNTTETIRVAFYNVQNFFDTLDDAGKDDAEFLPTSVKQWNTEKYLKKVQDIAKVINEMDAGIVGLAEIENKNVLDDLRGEMGKEWKYIHFESEDTRGVDVALVYNSSIVKVIFAIPHKVEVTGEPNYTTRDILQVQAVAKQDTFNFIVCHYHSRLSGVAESKHYRVAASNKVNEVIDKLPEMQLTLVMGDFNANPTDEPITMLNGITNAANKIDLGAEGSLPYDNHWQLYDQVLYHNPGKYKFQTFTIFQPTWLTNQTGFYKQYPFRTYAGDKYLGGFSDHFPVYIEFNY